MKKLLIVAVLAMALTLGMTGIAMANFAIHGGYLVDTDACAGCHRAHTAMSSVTWSDSGGDAHSALLISNATTMRDFCYACHGHGTLNGAKTDVQGGVLDGQITSDSEAGLGEVGKILNGGGFETLGYGNAAGATRTYGADTVDVSQKIATSQHDIDGTGVWYTTGSTIWGSWGPGTANGPGAKVDLNCTNCHDPHGSSNYRILNDAVQGRTVGGYVGDFKNDIDPDPDPWVISNEIGYPNGNGGADLGFRLHKVYWHNYPAGPEVPGDYMPDYTNACYAEPAKGDMNGAYNSTGMSGWCTRACHDQYLVKAGTLSNPGSGSSFGTYSASGTYNAGDDAGAVVRHRHPINVPVGVFDGDRALQLDPHAWTAWDPTIKWVDIPLLHLTRNGEAQGSPDNTSGNGTQTNTLDDGIDCLTCHRAHGTSAWMSGYANTDSNLGQAPPDSGIAGTPPTNDSALLRANDRGVCERCHNK